MVGQTVAHYRIEEELGRGGMGVVYKARDTRLDRYVALKFLPPYLTQDNEARQRFVREAKTAAGIQHHNICTVHDIAETSDGQTYIVMAYYGGETLKDLIAKGRLTDPEAADIACQVAQGLDAAHERGIVHRDIKPGNIVVSEKGQVKILDFGLAKLAGAVDLTKTSSTVGTASYMSPEQLRGQEADFHTDIWSLGVVLYEMVAGRRPFAGAYEQAVTYAILNEPPPPLDVDSELEPIIFQALEKEPAARIPSAEAFAGMLRRDGSVQTASATSVSKSLERRKTAFRAAGITVVSVLILAALWTFRPNESAPTAGASEPTVQSLAVLPFSNLRSDPDTDYLGYALADQVIGALTYLKNVTVRPSSSIRQYEGMRVDVADAGRDLKVEYVLSGTYLKENQNVRLTVELVDVESEELVWREPIEVSFENTFQLQDLVSQKVIDGLSLQFSSDEIARIRTDLPHDPLAYELYLRSISLPASAEGRVLAIQLLQQSIELDSLYAPAWDALGFRTRRAEIFSPESRQPSQRPARHYFERSLDLNPELLSALGNMVLLETDVGRLDEAYARARRIWEINSNSVLGHFALGYVFRYAGLLDESVEEMRTALAIDSTYRLLRSATSTFFQAGLYDETLNAAHIDQGSAYDNAWSSAALTKMGRTDEALALAMEILLEDPGTFESEWAEQQIAVINRDTASGLAASRRIDARAISDSEIWYYQSIYYSVFGEVETALDRLHTAIDRGYYAWQHMEMESYFDPIREHPRFVELLSLARSRSASFREKTTR